MMMMMMIIIINLWGSHNRFGETGRLNVGDWTNVRQGENEGHIYLCTCKVTWYDFTCCHICAQIWHSVITGSHIPGAGKSLARPGRKEARKHVRDARDFNNIETRAVKFFFFLQGKAPKEIHAILTETLVCFHPGRARDLSEPLYKLLRLDKKRTLTSPWPYLPPRSTQMFETNYKELL